MISKMAFLLSSILFLSLTSSFDQDTLSKLEYQINRVQKYISISPQELMDAQKLSDLNHYYRADWVKEYKSVEISILKNGQYEVIKSADNILTEEQKKALHSADRASDIKVNVSYLPDNNFSKDEIHQVDFTFRIDPLNDAVFIGGKEKLDKYITSQILDLISLEDVRQYEVAAVNFTIDEEGMIVDAHIAQASEKKEMDQLLLKAVCEMPTWSSASYKDGTNTKQDFVLTVGDQSSCTMNLLHIKSEVPPSILKEQ